MKIGDLAIIRTTGEQVLIIGHDKDNVNEFTIRRPVMTGEGITHYIDHFFEVELTTLENHLQSELTNHKLKQKLQKELLKDEDDNQPGPAAPISMLN